MNAVRTKEVVSDPDPDNASAYIDLRVPVVRRLWPSRASGVSQVPHAYRDQLGPDAFGIIMSGPELESFGIHSGDILWCRRQTTARPGQVVVIVGQVQDGLCIRVYPENGDLLELPEGLNDPFALAAPPRPCADVVGLVICVHRPEKVFRLGGVEPPPSLAPAIPGPRRRRPAIRSTDRGASGSPE